MLAADASPRLSPVISRVFILSLLLLGAACSAVLPGRGGAVLCIAAHHVAFENDGHAPHAHHHDPLHPSHADVARGHGDCVEACTEPTAGCVDLALPELTLQRAGGPTGAVAFANEAGPPAALMNAVPRGLNESDSAWASGRAPPDVGSPHLVCLNSLRLLV